MNASENPQIKWKLASKHNVFIDLIFLVMIVPLAAVTLTFKFKILLTACYYLASNEI